MSERVLQQLYREAAQFNVLVYSSGGEVVTRDELHERLPSFLYGYAAPNSAPLH
ncbi:hypothetical protein Deipr_0085 [Deinococcus proteolyticus MRP]|uniref:Uncharacterized protein n=1 Tax=Deinococcus proteolyticus (strain ATCC 35074 / DSM 20540 / JCM 6276 / NBRC 101906 / NCIMB 13154 / VKM Ac-1939 / CCM 2703 / MRP) TaxID=693977 RepID=F0RNM7_DEIPM|nr:hypothetical protein [Deinococcus proteolyticus]ADY25260.1 hypothetical protein Deipr_0085 [Deinococcus proteolyticus MRP]